MAVIRYGRLESQPPEGFFKPIYFPTLGRLDEYTGDGRLIESQGFSTRDLPLPIAHQILTAGGHDNSVNVGRLDVVEVDGNNIAGWGWLRDTPEGHAAHDGVKTGAYRGNSMDLAEVEVAVNPNFDKDFEDEEGFYHLATMQVRFTKSALAGTTLVMTPAFATAHAVIPDDEGELVASGGWTVSVLEPQGEVTAAAALDQIKQPWAAFNVPEPDELQPWTVDERGWVSGHLGAWGECHTGVQDRCVMIPHSRTHYGSYLKKNVLTENGLVPTGPVFLFNGHPEFATPRQIAEAYGGVENAWADITVRDGRFGPWACGMVRPGTEPERVYAARASGVSGHWFDGELYALVSVNAEGFNVPRRFKVDEEGHTQLIASAAPCDCNTEALSAAELAWLELVFDDEE